MPHDYSMKSNLNLHVAAENQSHDEDLCFFAADQARAEIISKYNIEIVNEYRDEYQALFERKLSELKMKA